MITEKIAALPRRLALFAVILTLIIPAAACAKEPAVPKIELDQSVGVYELMPEHGTLTISTVYFEESDAKSDVLLRETRDIFLDKYPGWKVEIIPEGELIRTATTLQNNPNAEDRYFDILPDRLRGDGGPDIISLSNADKERLINEHLLQDLMPMIYIDNEFNLDQILPGVRAVLPDWQGELYYLPMSFTFTVLNLRLALYTMRFSPDKFIEQLYTELPSPWTWESAAEFFKPEMERIGEPYLFSYTPQVFARYLLREYIDAIYNAETDSYDFNHPACREIFTTVYDLYKQGLLLDAEATESVQQISGMHGLLRFLPLYYAKITDYDKFITTVSYAGFHSIYIPLPEIGGARGFSIWPQDEFAISANASEKSAAWEFLKIMWSDEVQNSSNMVYQSILSEMNEEHIQRVLEISPFMDNYGEHIQAYNNERNKYFSQISHAREGRLPFYYEPETFLIYAKRYFLDELSLDELLNQLQLTAERK